MELYFYTMELIDYIKCMDEETFTIKPSVDGSISLPPKFIDKAKQMGIIDDDDTMSITDLKLLMRD